ncbi:helix-turn-helix domain-containing protein [Methylocapsa palsarum]|uniref:helix-turn-helix domain-containing protein n=1 Tax=Methylocapsa palsarum TaxID=1612308 RepID=UPI000B82B15F|nr:helix-turn-helix transcriptional regulator [Methylocapsa palsarum]
MTPEQCRAARGWLDWSQGDLASAASVSLSTVRDFEKGRRVPIPNNLGAMQAALEGKGIGFVDDGETCGITYAAPKNGTAH